jgi:hypothetical protein
MQPHGQNNKLFIIVKLITVTLCSLEEIVKRTNSLRGYILFNQEFHVQVENNNLYSHIIKISK